MLLSPIFKLGVMTTYGVKKISNGWLTGQTSMQLRIHGNPIKMLKSRYHGQTYRIKCVPMDYRPHNAAASDCEEDSREGPPLCPNTRTMVSVLNDTDAIPHVQESYGKMFNVDDYLVFKVQTFHPEYLGFQLEFYVHDPHKSPDALPKYIGFTHILPVDQKKSLSLRLRVPIMGLKHKPIGEVNVDSLIVKPHPRFSGKMDLSYQSHWKTKGKTLDVGHRGMGMSYKNIALVQENTLASFSAAASHGADMVEFDVMLTKDHMPVVYHDYAVCLSYKKRIDEEAELFTIPIKDLTLEHLHSMKLSHIVSHADLTEPSDSDETRPFPTLTQVLLHVDSRLDFNLEVKHPLIGESVETDQEHYFDHNLQVDKILETVFEHAGSRQIVFSSFDADTCIMLQLKQNFYPVLFLSNGPTSHKTYTDFRAKTFQAAISFAVSEGILGVDFEAEGVLQDMSVIKKSHNAGLIVFIWGEDANDKETIKLFRQHGADGIIYDRIDFHRPQDDVVFELDSSERSIIEEISCVSLPDDNYHRETESRSIS
ncbi:putative glycerophosphocholine phosphodiesterase GPCPD1 homolog 2 isoform X2 [Gigantopelta aegis]|uniref:putative glycerophosphocholine phosphodiesterase GPCPD1 homolog 2 isoform X2 n=1 Tax=Gigantopelta aegis TaxID=1735272 RepID=UPI001B88DA8F|nr:putative glycerophosphocholine phosphodiesterase GPCPD1 homolog 2 isoform X2 [Gigantopelta aegis]XP_041368484.1 putative glycerophosphocholine phosphodiesterase GPCPD1 homolog 2 isoform X2 [Gigantopelta aegis]